MTFELVNPLRKRVFGVSNLPIPEKEIMVSGVTSKRGDTSK